MELNGDDSLKPYRFIIDHNEVNDYEFNFRKVKEEDNTLINIGTGYALALQQSGKPALEKGVKINIDHYLGTSKENVQKEMKKKWK